VGFFDSLSGLLGQANDALGQVGQFRDNLDALRGRDDYEFVLPSLQLDRGTPQFFPAAAGGPSLPAAPPPAVATDGALVVPLAAGLLLYAVTR
jgi:hypothetical protein